MNVMIKEWIKRGYNNTMKIVEVPDDLDYPPWLGRDDVHASHRANLLRKAYDFYIKNGWTESPEDPYVWPVTD